MIFNTSRNAFIFFKSDLGVRFVAEGVVRSNAFVLTPLLSWSLGASVFGSYLQIMSLSFAFVPLVSAGLGFTIIRKLAGQKENTEAPTLLAFAIAIVSFLCLLLMLAIAVSADHIITYLSLDAVENTNWLIIIVPLLAWTFAIEALVGEYLRAMIRARASLYTQIAGFGIQMSFLAIVLALGRLSLGTALLSIAVAKLVVICFVLTPLLVHSRKTNRSQKNATLLRISISGLPFMLGGLAEWAGNLGDRLIVGRFLGAEAVAHYGASIMILSVLSALGAPIWWLLFPTVSAYIRNGDIESCRKTVKHHTMMFAELALPILAITILVINPTVSLLLNNSVNSLTPVIIIAGSAILTSQMTTGWEYYLVSVSAGKRLMAAATICSLAGFLSAWHLVSAWGLTGIACGMLIAKLSFGLFLAISANRNGFSGVAWRSGALLMLATLNIIVLSATYYIGQYVFTPTSKIYEIAVPIFVFTALYCIGRYLLIAVLRRLSVQ